MGVYVPPSIRTVREDLQPTVVITGGEVIPLLIGTSNGRVVTVAGSGQTQGAAASHVFAEPNAVEVILEARSKPVGGIKYVEDTDFTFVFATQTLTWLATTLDPPYLLSVTPSTTGGSVPDATHFYVVTAERETDTVGPVTGETTISNELSVVNTGGGTSTNTLVWNPVVGAEAYNVWRSTTTGTYTTPALIANVVGEFANTYEDTAAAPGVGAPSGSNTAFKRPAFNAVADNWYVDYMYTQTEDFTIKRFTDLGDLLAEHGLGSNLSIAGTLAMGTSGRGNAASILLTMSIPDDLLATYQTAFDFARRRKDIDIVVPLTSTSTIQTSLLAHVQEQSGVDQKRERIGVIGFEVGTQIGSESETGTAVARARAIDDERIVAVYPWPVVDVQDSTGAIVETELDGHFMAAALAGRFASLADRATPATGKQLFGVKSLGSPNGEALDEDEQNILGAAGITVITEEITGSGIFTVRDSLTTSLDSFLQHPNIILTDDFLRKTLRQNFADFRGRKLLGPLLLQIDKRTKRTLQSLFKLGLITFFDPETVSVIQDPDFPTQVLVRFSYRPVFPLRIIEFRYSFDLRSVSLAA